MLSRPTTPRPSGNALERRAPGRASATIASSWQRSEGFGLDPGHELNLPFDGDRDRSSRLLRAAEPVLHRLSQQLVDSAMCLMLSDSKGWIVRREAASRRLGKLLDRITIVQGARATEETAATNGLGTVLHERRPLVLKGADHFIESMQAFTCVGAPIIHPITGRLEGVLDLSCGVDDTSELLLPLITGAASEIEQRFYELASSRERALFDAFAMRNRRTSQGVACLNEDVLFTNGPAAQLFDPEDHMLMWDWASGVAGSGRDVTGIVTLSRGRSVTAHAAPVADGVSSAGVLVTFTESRSPSGCPRGNASSGGVAGGPQWSSVWRATVRAARVAAFATGIVLLRGERGVGKSTLALTAGGHRLPTGAEQGVSVVDVDCRSGRTATPAWVTTAVDAVRQGVPLVVRHIEDASPEAAAVVAQAARERSGACVVMTTSDLELPPPWESSIDVVIDVPPLRDRVTDIPALVQDIIDQRVPDDRRVRCSAPALAALMRREWPGNLSQLKRTIATALVNSMHSDITEQDLPREDRQTTATTHRSRSLTGLETAERDAIVSALRSADWKREAAAKALGISRATIYRKIQSLGIKSPPLRPDHS